MFIHNIAFWILSKIENDKKLKELQLHFFFIRFVFCTARNSVTTNWNRLRESYDRRRCDNSSNVSNKFSSTEQQQISSGEITLAVVKAVAVVVEVDIVIVAVSDTVIW